MKEAGMQACFFSEERRKLLIFIAIGCFLLLSETIYDLVFANIAYSLTGKTTSVTTTYAIGYVAEIIVTILGAGFIDQFNKWRLFIATQILNIMVFALAMIVLSRDYIHIISLWGFAFFVDLIHHYSRLIIFSLTPFLFIKEQILLVNSTKAVAYGLANAIGPTLGALAILYVGLNTSLLVSVGLMLASLILTLSMAVRSPLEEQVKGIQTVQQAGLKERFEKSIWGTARAVYQLLKHLRWRVFLLSYSSCVLVIGVLVLLWIPFLRGFHGFATQQTGYLFSVATIGGIIGALVFRRYGQQAGIVRVLQLSHFIMLGGIVLALGIRGNIYMVGVGMFIFAFGSSLYFRSTESVMQIAIPKDVLGSWYGAIDFITRFFGLAWYSCSWLGF